MKKFRMTPIHYWMVGLLSFIILAITSRLFGGTLANLVILFFSACRGNPSFSPSIATS